jgi:FlaA1/EpsC-like NDP-sugar epimerase
VRQWFVGFDLGRRLAVWAVQICIFALAGVVAFLLRFDFQIPHHYAAHLAFAVPVWIVAKVIVFRSVNLNRGWWRYVSARDLIRITVGNMGGSLLGGLFILLAGPPGFPRSIFLLDGVLCLLGTAGVRVAVRLIWEASLAEKKVEGRKPTLIYGAGNAGMTLLREIQVNPGMPYDVRGFVDDRRGKKGMNILGIRVLGCGEEVEALVRKHSIEMILIAIPSAPGAAMDAIVERCKAAGVEYKTIPGLGQMIQNRDLSAQIRDVAVEDILGREPVRLEQEHIREKVENAVVMVTGAGGSIGSELCRQIARFHPAILVGFDIGETPIFHLEREMEQSFPGLTFRGEIGNIQNVARLNEVLRRYSPSAIFHAAAYKHVPLMESHVCEAVENNVLGTYNVAAAAIRCAVRDFVLISSDKAVKPANIMGATKRVAELLVLAQNAVGKTKFVCVRFGNVLGSNGSVAPILRRQIAAGGPVTVTHPDMRRFFMTIPEAAQLVLQAYSMGRGGEIFVLDMGRQIKIVDLARKMIALSGLQPDRDIKIVFTGVRPGEKMYEELSLLEEGAVPTVHEKIRIFSGNGRAQPVDLRLAALREAVAQRDAQALTAILKEMVPDYAPAGEHGAGSAAMAANQ